MCRKKDYVERDRYIEKYKSLRYIVFDKLVLHIQDYLCVIPSIDNTLKLLGGWVALTDQINIMEI